LKGLSFRCAALLRKESAFVWPEQIPFDFAHCSLLPAEAGLEWQNEMLLKLHTPE
jgi:hypothetical protein